VMQVRAELIAAFAALGACSNQIGRAYPYASVLRPESRALLEAIKTAVDPHGVMNPGALELT
jgi:D-lactate dehydrogenase (cytochrome)